MTVTTCGVSMFVRAIGIGLEPLGRDRLAGDLVDAVRAFVEPLQRGFDLGELALELLEDREVLLALERLGRLVGRVGRRA